MGELANAPWLFPNVSGYGSLIDEDEEDEGTIGTG
jgi:hypothetical protein